MIRRRSRTWVFVAAAAVSATAGRAGAASIATYQLKNTGTATVSQVLAEISPAGAVFAPTSSSANPFTIIYTPSGADGKSLSGGFDTKTDKNGTTPPLAPPTDAIGTGKLANGDPLQVLNLQFDKNGFAPGGVLNFSLNLGSNFTGPTPTLILEDPTTGLTPAGLSITSFTAPTSTPTGTGTGTTGGSSRGGRQRARAGLARPLVGRRRPRPAPGQGVPPRPATGSLTTARSPTEDTPATARPHLDGGPSPRFRLLADWGSTACHRPPTVRRRD